MDTTLRSVNGPPVENGAARRIVLEPGQLSRPEKVWATSSTLIIGFHQAAPYSESFKIFYKKSGAVFGTQVTLSPATILGPELARHPLPGETQYFEYEIKKLKPSTPYVIKIKTGDDPAGGGGDGNGGGGSEVRSDKMGTISAEEERTRDNDMRNFVGALVKLADYDGLVLSYSPPSGIFAVRILQVDDLAAAQQLVRLASDYTDNGLPVQAYTLSQVRFSRWGGAITGSKVVNEGELKWLVARAVQLADKSDAAAAYEAQQRLLQAQVDKVTAGLEAEWSGRFSRLRMRTVATLLLLALLALGAGSGMCALLSSSLRRQRDLAAQLAASTARLGEAEAELQMLHLYRVSLELDMERRVAGGGGQGAGAWTAWSAEAGDGDGDGDGDQCPVGGLEPGGPGGCGAGAAGTNATAAAASEASLQPESRGAQSWAVGGGGKGGSGVEAAAAAAPTLPRLARASAGQGSGSAAGAAGSGESKSTGHSSGGKRFGIPWWGSKVGRANGKGKDPGRGGAGGSKPKPKGAAAAAAEPSAVGGSAADLWGLPHAALRQALAHSRFARTPEGVRRGTHEDGPAMGRWAGPSGRAGEGGGAQGPRADAGEGDGVAEGEEEQPDAWTFIHYVSHAYAVHLQEWMKVQLEKTVRRKVNEMLNPNAPYARAAAAAAAGEWPEAQQAEGEAEAAGGAGSAGEDAGEGAEGERTEGLGVKAQGRRRRQATTAPARAMGSRGRAGQGAARAPSRRRPAAQVAGGGRGGGAGRGRGRCGPGGRGCGPELDNAIGRDVEDEEGDEDYEDGSYGGTVYAVDEYYYYDY